MILDLKEQTNANNNFRKVLATNQHSQLVTMCLQPGEDIGLEVHDLDQFLYVVDGTGEAVVGSDSDTVQAGSAVIVPAGAEHNVTNTGQSELKLFTVYSPAEHADGTVHPTKADAEAAENH